MNYSPIRTWAATGLLAATALLAANYALAADRLLGSTHLTRAENDKDVIQTTCRPRVTAIKLKALRGQIEIEALWVRFKNGERERLAVRDRIAEGGESRWIDLPGGRRCVVSIGIIGDTELSRDQARVDVYGRF